MSAGDKVRVVAKQIPADYHCDCKFCTKAIGELRPDDESYYSRLERRKYYDPSEKGKDGHIAKTPLHIARWAVQKYTKPGDWVVDPTIGAGTTAVEAITQGRNVAGMEIQYGKILEANIDRNIGGSGVKAIIRISDARKIADFFKDEKVPRPQLVVNNPPYSGDENAKMPAKGSNVGTYRYESDLPNLAFLRENTEYWAAIRQIYQACVDHMLPGGYFVTGIKDMMRRKQPFFLHRDFCELLVSLGMKPVGTAFLRHYPGTLFLHTYEKRYGVAPPYYQTINVFRKPVPK